MKSTPQTEQEKQTGSSPKPSQSWDASAYAANGRFVADLAGDVVGMLAVQPNERVLDLGCGDGALTERLAAGGAEVVACDADSSMLAAAASRGLKAVHADMRDLPFREEFDAVFSNAALHWVLEQDAVLQGVARALRPGGRFVAEMGGLGNIAAIRTALQAVLRPYGVDAEASARSFYPSANVYRALLQAHGFSVISMELVPRPTLLKSGMEAWLRTFRSGVLAALSESDRDAAVQETVRLLEPVLRDSDGTWWGDYVRLRFHATKAA